MPEDEIDAAASLVELRRMLRRAGWSTVGLGDDDFVPEGTTRGTVRLAFGLDQLAEAIRVTSLGAEGLSPGTSPQAGGLKLMRIHIEEEIATSTAGETDLVLSFVDGLVRVRPESWSLPVPEE